MQDCYTFPALFCYDLPGQVGVVFPDLPGCVSQGDDEADALRMAKEALGGHLLCMEEEGWSIPDPTPLRDIRPEHDEAPVLVDVFMPPIRSRADDTFVNKTVTMPRWLATEGKAAGVNFSQVLQDALMERLGIHRAIDRRRGRRREPTPAS